MDQTNFNLTIKHPIKKTYCNSCFPIKPVLLLRFALRSAVPILVGVGFGMLSEWGERTIGMHNNNSLLELSDFISCGITLITAYTINYLLNCCWPAHPYQQSDFFQIPLDDRNTNNTSAKNGFQHA